MLISPFLLAGALLATPTASGPVKPTVALKRLSGCGFQQVHIRYDQTFQEDVIEIRDGDVATDAQLACAAKVSIATIYYISMPDALQPRYDAIYQRLSVEDDVASARQWFAKRGMLARLPKYDKAAGDDPAFAKRLEQFCGKRAEGALGSELGPHAIDASWMARERRQPDKGKSPLQCLSHAARATGFAIGFTGNEAGSAAK